MRAGRLRESGRLDSEHTVLLLPGARRTAAFYDDLVAEPRLREASFRLVAATLPGHGRTPPPVDLRLENYARLAGKLARDLGCDLVVGHSLGANVAIEMARHRPSSAGRWSCSHPASVARTSSRFLRAMDGLATALGTLPFRMMLAMVGLSMKGVKVSPARRAELVAALRRNDPRFVQAAMRAYLEYLDRHGSLAALLCESGVPAWVVFGDHDDVGLRADERSVLEECPDVTMAVVTDAGHLTLNEQPAQVAEIVIEAVSHARA